ncbi:AI-2E family transporter [Spirillospora sp. NPDC029432]|uniref:AI-2E family transporter n=1 Tax=Spirillospora sp. NPDC029432 TaxID=3154599 RepID=UPI0034526F65
MDSRDKVPPPGLQRAALTAACLLVLTAAGGLVLWLLVHLAPLTLALVATLLMAALVEPIPRWLRAVRVPAWLAALAGVLALLAIIAVPIALIGNQTVRQWPHLRKGLDEGLDKVRDLLLNGPFPINTRQLDSITDTLQNALVRAAPDPAAGAGAATQTVASIVIALVLLFFVLKDGPGMWRWALGMIPRRSRERVDTAARAGWEALVSYIRGTVLVAAVDAAGIGVALLVIGVPLALPLALLTFVAAFVPIVGATVAGAAAVLIAFVSNGLTDALLVLAAVILVQQAEGNLLQPLIMGRALNLHPAVILVAVTAGTLLAGIAGAIVAVPITAVGYRVAMVLHRDRAGPEQEPEPEPEPVGS